MRQFASYLLLQQLSKVGDAPCRCIRPCLQVPASVTTAPKAWVGASKLEKPDEKIRTALGLHPQLAHSRIGELELFDSLLPSVKYIGEIGLDGSKEYKSHIKIQLKAFNHILNSCQRSGGGMLVHSRLSATLVLGELKKYPYAGIPIFHWFSGTEKELNRAIEIGVWFSIGPSMLNSKKGFSTVSKIPINRVLTETDGPFGKIKGKALMSWGSAKTLCKLARIWNVGEKEVEHIVFENLKQLLAN